MSLAYEESTARIALPQPTRVEPSVPRIAAPGAKRVLIIGYLTYRGDARVKRQVRTLTAAGYAVDLPRDRGIGCARNVRGKRLSEACADRHGIR